MSNITQITNPDEVFSDYDLEYDAGVTEAEQTLERIALMIQSKSEAFVGGFWDTIFDALDE